MKTARWMAAAVALFSAGAMVAPAARVVVDNFDEGGLDAFVDSTLTSTNYIQSGLQATNVLGGTRYFDLVWEAGASTVVKINVTGGFAGVDSSSSADTADAYHILSYGRGSPMNADLSQSGANKQFEIAWENSDSSRSDITITVSNGANNAVSYSFKTPFTESGVTQIVAFSNFTGFDFSDVDQIDIKLDGVANWDGRIDFVTANIPEPGTATMLALVGLGGFLFRRRLRRK
jgi:hypothetical protein